jgi:hypothetical protein
MLQGEKHRLMVWNAEHSMATNIPAVIAGLSEFANSVYNNLQRPSFTWTIDESKGTIEVQEQGTQKATKATLR